MKLLPRPRGAHRQETISAKRKSRSKIQRKLDAIPERILPRISTMDFDEFRQKYRRDPNFSSFPANPLLVNATHRAQHHMAVRTTVRKKSATRPIIRRQYRTTQHEEGIDAFPASNQWKRQHGDYPKLRRPGGISMVPQLQLTSRTPLPAEDQSDRQGGRQGGRPGIVESTHYRKTTTKRFSDLPTSDPITQPVSQSARQPVEPAISSEQIGRDLPKRRAVHVRAELRPQQPVRNALAQKNQVREGQNASQNASEKVPSAVEEDIERLQGITSAHLNLVGEGFENSISTIDPACNDSACMPSSLGRAVETIDTVPQGSQGASFNALTGVGMTEYLLEIMNPGPAKAGRTSALSLRQQKLEERARRIQLKRQQQNESPEDIERFRQLPRTQTQNPQIARSKIALRSAPSRIGLIGRSKSVGATSIQPTGKEFKGRYEAKSIAALVIRMLSYGHPLLMGSSVSISRTRSARLFSMLTCADARTADDSRIANQRARSIFTDVAVAD